MRSDTSFAFALACALLLLVGAAPVQPPNHCTDDKTKIYLTVDEALGKAFPDCRVERQAVYLTEDQTARIAKLSGDRKFDRRIVYEYVARKQGTLVGRGYFDTHVVRSLRETLLVAVAADGSIRELRLLAFAEPPRYVPRAAFYDQFKGEALDAELELGRGVHGSTGATLTALATTGAARRALAIHGVLHPAPKPKPAPKPEPKPEPEPKPIEPPKESPPKEGPKKKGGGAGR